MTGTQQLGADLGVLFKQPHTADVLAKVTTTNICGSDLRMYEGRTSFEQRRTYGHENTGDVVEVGQGVEKVKVGDRLNLDPSIGMVVVA